MDRIMVEYTCLKSVSSLSLLLYWGLNVMKNRQVQQLKKKTSNCFCFGRDINVIVDRKLKPPAEKAKTSRKFPK